MYVSISIAKKMKYVKLLKIIVTVVKQNALKSNRYVIQIAKMVIAVNLLMENQNAFKKNVKKTKIVILMNVAVIKFA